MTTPTPTRHHPRCCHSDDPRVVQCPLCERDIVAGQVCPFCWVHRADHALAEATIEALRVELKRLTEAFDVLHQKGGDHG